VLIIIDNQRSPASQFFLAPNTIPYVRCSIAEKPLSDLATTLPVAAEDVKATARAEAVAVAGMKKDAAAAVPAAELLW
jgi:hypothetical protein